MQRVMNVENYDPFVVVRYCPELRPGSCKSCGRSLDHQPGWCLRRSDGQRADWVCQPCKEAGEARDARRLVDSVPDVTVIADPDEEYLVDLLFIPCDD